MNKIVLSCVFAMAITMPALAGDIMQFQEEPQHARMMRANAIGLYNAAEQAIIFFLAAQDGNEKRFSIPSNASWELSDRSSSQYIIRIPISGGRDVRYPLTASLRYRIYWNSDKQVWDVALNTGP